MTIAPINKPALRKPLRLWPGVVAVVLEWLGLFILPAVVAAAGMYGMLGGFVCGLAVFVWWLFFSRAPWSERLGAIVLMVAAVSATSRFVHQSIANGMMGMMLPIYSIPVLSLALVAWALASRRLSSGPRRASMVGSILLACVFMTLVRTGGLNGEGNSDFHWRWTKTPEEKLLAQPAEPQKLVLVPTAVAPANPASTPAVGETLEKRAPVPASATPATPFVDLLDTKTIADWPGFRGPARDGIVPGVRIETDWSRQPPVELWRRPIGPGWSSFAVQGN